MEPVTYFTRGRKEFAVFAWDIDDLWYAEERLSRNMTGNYLDDTLYSQVWTAIKHLEDRGVRRRGDPDAVQP